MTGQPRIAAVLPCYRSRDTAPGVIARFGPEVEFIIAVDDACPDSTGDAIEAEVRDPRLHIVRLARNLGVGGATKAGFLLADELGADIVVKVDSDGQMDPSDLARLVRPISSGRVDAVKGNRFYDPRGLSAMPLLRLVGNSVLSFLTKWSSGYWNLFDPTNGYVAIHTKILRQLPLDRIDNRYFFESDLLFRLYLSRACVQDMPLIARYGSERSHLSELSAIHEFLWKNLRNGVKRIILTYFIRDFRPASLEMMIGLPMLGWGLIYGLGTWSANAGRGETSTAGEVMLAALPIILGAQLLLSALNEDIRNRPDRPLHPDLPDEKNLSQLF